MYAIVQTGGKQYRVQPGDEIHIEKLPNDVGEVVDIAPVLMYADGEKVSVGTPGVESVKRAVDRVRGLFGLAETPEVEAKPAVRATREELLRSAS